MFEPVAHAMTTVDGCLTITQYGPNDWDELAFSFFGDAGAGDDGDGRYETFIAVPIWKLVNTLVDLGLVARVK